MAQIVTITNPLTGQPTQVDQLEHTAQQIDDGIGFESTDYLGCYYRLVNGVVEWFNPPMKLGEEYRTTERFYECQVYKKLVTLGKVPAAGSTASIDGGHGISGIKYAISAVPLIYKSAWTVTLQGSERIDDIDFNTMTLSVKISSAAGDLSSYELLVLLTYAKAD